MTAKRRSLRLISAKSILCAQREGEGGRRRKEGRGGGGKEIGGGGKRIKTGRKGKREEERAHASFSSELNA